MTRIPLRNTQVKKLYVHLWMQNQILMDWDVPLDATGAITPYALAVAGFEKHSSQYGYFRVERQGVQYDNRLFGLYFTSVGPDVKGGDFFDNVP